MKINGYTLPKIVRDCQLTADCDKCSAKQQEKCYKLAMPEERKLKKALRQLEY
jgi:hypothetical protein